MASQIRAPHYFTIGSELAVIPYRHYQVAVACCKDLIRHHILMSVPSPLWRYTRSHVVQGLVGQHCDMTIQQSHINILSQAAAVSFLQRPQNGHASIHTSEKISHRDAGFLWAAAWQVITLAGDTHQAAHALNHEIVAGQ